MLRFGYTVLDILATIFALMSPIAILHWLLAATGLDLPFMAFLASFYAPFNGMADALFHPPDIQFEAQRVATAQGIVGVVFTLSFFICNAASQALKSAEQKVVVAKESFEQRRRLEKLKQEKQRQEKKAVTNKKLLVYLQYDFETSPAGGAQFESRVAGAGGRVLESGGGSMMMEFQSLERALSYCLLAGDNVLKHYETLRPMDPQPPFQLAVHAVDASDPAKNGYPKLWQLVKYAGMNFVVLSSEARDMLEVNGLGTGFRYQSMGMYSFEMEKNQEIFRLLGKKEA